MKLRTVVKFVDPVQFGMAKSVLEEAGIPFDEAGRTINSAEGPSSAFVINDLHLQVLEHDFARASELLSATVGRGVVE